MPFLQSNDEANDPRAVSINNDDDYEAAVVDTKQEFQCEEITLTGIAGDLIASLCFWYLQFFSWIKGSDVRAFQCVVVVMMILWRIHRYMHPLSKTAAQIPYTCASATFQDKEMIIVATLHIAPRAPRDVHTVIREMDVDCAMIELDEERLERMREPAPIRSDEIPEPRPDDLQSIRIASPEAKTLNILAQRALWNAEWTDQLIAGNLVYDAKNAYGLDENGHSLRGSIALIKRGAEAEEEWAPFALKAHIMAKLGAKALVVMSHDDRLPLGRLGAQSMQDEFKLCHRTCSCGFPPIPVLLIPKTDGERLMQLCIKNRNENVATEFKVMPDDKPRRTLLKRICQASGLLCSGIGILYGVIRCCAVEVGGEFLAAEEGAQMKGIPCECIDVNMNRFWKKISDTLLPWPSNVLNSLWCWLRFPRNLLFFLFPPRTNVDILGAMLLHLASLPCKTWLAFIFAGLCASTVTSTIFSLISYGVTETAEATGVVEQENADDFQVLLALGVELYVMPQVYTAIAASRDEAMYQSIVKKVRQFDYKRFVVVVGGGHANGILQRFREFGV